MTGIEVQEIYDSVQKLPSSAVTVELAKLATSTQKFGKDIRVGSESIEDAFFGDSGKGAVVAKINRLDAGKGSVFSLRYNGGGNAGHEAVIGSKKVVTNQLPMGVVEENVTAAISRGMVIHPEDLLTEISRTAAIFGGFLPGKLVIDERVLLALDTHRALEGVFNGHTTGGRGSTGRGISPAYASLYQRHPVTLKQLLAPDWKETLGEHYELYDKMVRGFDTKLSEIAVYNMALGTKEGRLIGGKGEFIERLGDCREELRDYVHTNFYSLLQKIWQDPRIAFTLEGAQGAGLDPYHGVYPDVTASRPMSRFITDATYGLIEPTQLERREAVMKTSYLSSVGIRTLPTIKDEAQEVWIRNSFDETGRTTGRPRDIYPITLPIASYLRKVAGYDSLVATHLDAAREGEAIMVITHYTDRAFGAERPYLPHQDQLDRLEAQYVKFPGWDGEAVKDIKTLKDLPIEARRYLLFLGKTIAPVAMATTGPGLDEYILF